MTLKKLRVILTIAAQVDYWALCGKPKANTVVNDIGIVGLMVLLMTLDRMWEWI